MDAQRRILLAILSAGVVIMVAAAAIFISKPQMGPLFTDLDPSTSAEVLRALDETDTPYQVSADGGVIYAPKERIARLRMTLAEQGLPGTSGVGYEIFDERGSLGLTSFMQEVNRLRALEGELSRTIQTLQDIDSARVHIVMSQRDPFSRDRVPPTASVTVRMRGAALLEARHASAIRHLVASSVPHLQASAVSVLDARGGVIFSDEGTGMGAAQTAGLQSETETRLRQAVERVLMPRLGPGNARVEVAAILHTERELIREESFDPKQAAVRSRQVSDEVETSRESTNETPTTVEQNLPEAEVDADIQNGAASQTERTEEVTNFELSTVRREVIREPGDLKRLSVAVLVNGRYEEGADGARVYQPRTEDELESIEALVKSAVGFDVGRGDSVTIENLEFFDLDAELPPSTPPSAQLIIVQNITAILQWIALLTIALVLIVFVVRPMVMRLIPDTPTAAAAAAASAEEAAPAMLKELAGAEAGEGFAAALADGTQGEDGEGPLALPNMAMDETLDQMLEFRDVEGKVRASSVRKLGQIVENHPEEVVAILRTWIYEDAE